MTPFRPWFNTYKDVDGEFVYMGNNEACKIKGVNLVSLKLKYGLIKLLRNVRHVPLLKRNLISLGILDTIGCECRGKDGILEVIKDSKMVGEKVNDLYIVRGVKMMTRKATRQSFTKSQHTTKGTLDYVHSDLWRPSSTPRLSGSSDNGINSHKTVRYTPQQNGLAERINRTIMEKKTLRFLGVGFVHQNKGKLKARAVKCMFVGFTEGVKGYKMWHPVERKFIISRDITFREEKMFMEKEKRLEDEAKSSTTGIKVEIPTEQPKKSNLPSDTREFEEDEGEQGEIVNEQPDLSQYVLARDRQTITTPVRYTEMNYMNLVLNVVVALTNQEPTTFEEATSCVDAMDWIEAMNEEMHSLKLPLNGFSNLRKLHPVIRNLGIRQGSYKDKVYLLIYVNDMLLAGSYKDKVYLLIYVDDMLLAAITASVVMLSLPYLSAIFTS
ncbi:uncharacterized protein LOC120080985 [Benincasa hispida]|uniref:uncharacterized protein LOC120080985 n=1 Tax=Benincasa hispida TaxID=102211 RepID=UPI0019015CEA|nr:uncharacterized protein LOC120080985 [Benincasa hispida]